MQKYRVTGMHCAACQARVEKAASGVEGVESVAASLLTNTLGITGDARADAVIKAIEKAGYSAVIMDDDSPVTTEERSSHRSAEKRRAQEEALLDNSIPELRMRLLLSAALLLVLMYISMGHSMLGLPVPDILASEPVAMAAAEMILTGIVLIINRNFFTSGFGSLIRLSPNMDSLVAIGSMTSFLWSFVTMLRMIAVREGAGNQAAMEYLHQLYFESAAMILTLITVGKLLEEISKGRTTDALRSLFEMSPKTAILERREENAVRNVEVPVEDVAKEDVFICRAGDTIPVDGIIIEGETAVDESALTGESIPVDRKPGDPISAGTINTSGFIRAKAIRVGEDTTLSQIIRMVSDASATKAPIARIADRVAAVFVPVVIAIAIIVTLIWLISGAGIGYALARGIAVLVISCPCALGLATPVAIMVGSGKGARNGILFKTAQSLEMAGRVRLIALDKTGTITEGQPRVTDVIPTGSDKRSDLGAMDSRATQKLLSYALALETGSEHPLGKAVVAFGREEGLEPAGIVGIRALPGRGIEGQLVEETLDKEENPEKEMPVVRAGSMGYIGSVAEIPEDLAATGEELSREGKTLLFFAENDKVLGLIAVADRIKEDSPEAIDRLRSMGIEPLMLTGDREETARAIAAKAGIRNVAAQVMPQDKERIIRQMKEQGPVVMVGDGINDAPALQSADVGIAIGAGTDVAIDAADVVVMNSSLMDVAAAISLSRKTIRNVHENLFWAFFYNILLIPLAAGIYTKLLHGWTLDPMLAAAAMSLSSFCVCTNALRLNLVDIHDGREKRAAAHKEDPSEEKGDTYIMKKTLKIQGMMCPHCEATVKKALEEIQGVSVAFADHEKDLAQVELISEVEDEKLIKAVEDKDYTVISIG